MKLTAHGFITLSDTPNARTIRGTIVEFDKPTDDRRGLIIRAGALNPREPLKRTKLLRDHDHRDPVGYMTSISGDRQSAEFEIPDGENGDRALAEAQNGLRDGFSIGFTIEEYSFDDEDNIVVTKAIIHEVSLVVIPAFAGAGISAALAFNPTPTPSKGAPMNPEQLAAALAAGILSQEEHDTQLAALTTPPAPAQPLVGELAGTPAAVPVAPQPVHTNPRPVSLRQLAQDVSAAIARDDRASVRLALDDVVPADDAGEAFIRDDWRGELWQADNSARPMIDALGAPKPLQTGSKIKGWAWDVKPDVDDYSGNKTEVPSNKPKTKPVEVGIHRSAGGWDIDRIFIDLGDAGFLESFWRAAVADYKADAEDYCATQMLEQAFELPTQPTLLKGLSKLGSGFAAIGASLDAIFIAPDLFEEYAELTQSEVPFWLANATGVSLRNQSATVADLNIKTHPALAAGEITAFDMRAADWFEKQPPIRVNAIDLPKGGIDLGLFGYDALLVNDARALVKMQIGAGP